MDSCHKLKKIWNFTPSRKIKIEHFIATVEGVLLYGCAARTVTKALEKGIDGCYTRMLRMALGVSWNQKLTNEHLYKELPPVTSKVTYIRLKLAGHFIRQTELSASSIVLWELTKRKARVRRPSMTYIGSLR